MYSNPYHLRHLILPLGGILLILTVMLGLPEYALAAPTIDNHHIERVNGTGASFSYVTGAGATLMVIAVSSDSGAQSFTATYNSVSATEIDSAGSGSNTLTTFTLANPASGSHTVSIPSGNVRDVTVVTFFNSATTITNSIRDSNGGTSWGTTITIAATSICYMTEMNNNNATPTYSNGTELDSDFGMTHGYNTTTTSCTIGGTWNQSGNRGLIMEIATNASSPTSPNTRNTWSYWW